MNNPIFSICITHHNNSQTVRNTLETLLVQLDKRLELVVADDFSTDRSAAILDKYDKQGKIQLIQEYSNRGVGGEAALEVAGGKYVTSGLDTDDVCKPTLPLILRFYHNVAEGNF
jgi:glycosyltransferase involved in cell wall biosynthesis